MNEIIKITEQNGRQAVSARELYERLGFAPQHWANWYKKNIMKNPFAISGQDFIQLPLSGRTIDFALSIDFAKRLSMMARTETGEQIRNYFIEVENRATKPKSAAELLLQQCQIMVEHERRMSQLEEKVGEIEAKTTTRPDYFTVVGYATIRRIPCGLSLASRMGRRASQLCKERGIPTDEIPDPRFGKVKLYPKHILQEVFDTPLN